MPIPVVINACYGGFGLSPEGLDLYNSYRQENNLKPKSWCRIIERNDPLLVKVVQTLGSAANGSCASLYIVYIPDVYEEFYDIDEYDGFESIKYRTDDLIMSKFIDLDIDSLNLVDSHLMLKDILSILQSR